MAESPITARSQDFATWYQDVVLQGDMAEPAEIVKGCMVIKANGWAVWEVLQRDVSPYEVLRRRVFLDGRFVHASRRWRAQDAQESARVLWVPPCAVLRRTPGPPKEVVEV